MLFKQAFHEGQPKIYDMAVFIDFFYINMKQPDE